MRVEIATSSSLLSVIPPPPPPAMRAADEPLRLAFSSAEGLVPTRAPRLLKVPFAIAKLERGQTRV